ncbi:unnamed protein product [Bemisia tabaci]|uniref:Uncharacterized protein n=1 Tax=Bemisia tabaci TaxID=7038 RepID=A0A9P0A893_BEMTA|nr:unnamed protein product [Bemisia tabaci]
MKRKTMNQSEKQSDSMLMLAEPPLEEEHHTDREDHRMEETECALPPRSPPPSYQHALKTVRGLSAFIFFYYFYRSKIISTA